MTGLVASYLMSIGFFQDASVLQSTILDDMLIQAVSLDGLSHGVSFISELFVLASDPKDEYFHMDLSHSLSYESMIGARLQP